MISIRPAARADEGGHAAGAPNRVPRVTGMFWLVKVLTTGMGETTSDFFVKQFAPEVVVPIALVALLLALAVQFRMHRYRPGVYWTTALMVSIFGTMAADVLHVGLGVPYLASTMGFAIVLAAVFAIWFASERTLSMHDITTRRREAFYWATVLATFALGTALGDLTATGLGLGYLASALLFLVVIAVPAVARLVFRMNAIVTFWAAYVVTRPLGASIADWMAVSRQRGGLDLGTGAVSAVALALFVALVAWLMRRERRELREPAIR